MDINLIKLVAEDLEFLSKGWNQQIDEASLRRASPILRSLLVENKLYMVGRYFELDIRVMAPEDSGASLDAKERVFWQACGGKSNGLEVLSMSMWDRALTDDEIDAMAMSSNKRIGKSHPVKVSSFLRQTSFVLEGTSINREEVIKYVANKLGGAHYDSTRKENTKPETSLDEKYVLLDSVRNQWKITDKDAVYFELLSIGQLLINSRDVQTLRRKIASFL